MKKRSAKILSSLLLLLTFITGQIIVVAHTHHTDARRAKHYSQQDKSKTTEDECPVCIQHGHINLLFQQHQICFWFTGSSCAPVTFTVLYQSIELLLSGNRGPPAL